MDQFLVLNVVAGTTPVNVPALLQMSLDVCKKLQDFFGRVKTAKAVVKFLRNGPDDINEIGSELYCIQRQLTERQLNEDKLENSAKNSLKNEYCILNKSLRKKSIYSLRNSSKYRSKSRHHGKKAMYRLLYQT